jgi:hypothetical protein
MSRSPLPVDPSSHGGPWCRALAPRAPARPSSEPLRSCARSMPTRHRCMSSPLRSTPACVPRLPPGATRVALAASLRGRRPRSRRLAATTSPAAFPCRHPIRALAPWSGLRAHCYAPRRGCQPASRRRTRPGSVRPAPPPSTTGWPLHFSQSTWGGRR